MTVLSGSCSAELKHPIGQVWALVADIERAPDWQRTLERVEVRERDEDGRPLICDTVSDARLTKVAVRIRVSYEEPRRLSFSQLESDDLDSMEGAWVLEELGPDRTRATYSLALDPGPIPFFARPLERAIRPVVMGHQAKELAAALASM